jgi:hypothetical protein
MFGSVFITADGSNGVTRGECFDAPGKGEAGADRTVGYCLWYMSGEDTFTEETRGFNARSMAVQDDERAQDWDG